MDINLLKLKVKAKSLAEEARIIRAEENKLKRIPYMYRRIEGQLYGETVFSDPITSLNIHRTWDVRNEARATQLAIAYLKGKTYKQVEPNSKTYESIFKWYIADRVATIVNKYNSVKGTKLLKQDILLWVKE